jgi:hypothetical protein
VQVWILARPPRLETHRAYPFPPAILPSGQRMAS